LPSRTAPFRAGWPTAGSFESGTLTVARNLLTRLGVDVLELREALVVIHGRLQPLTAYGQLRPGRGVRLRRTSRQAVGFGVCRRRIDPH
jgi:hypothetical protein